MLVIFHGPSGVGKTTVMRGLASCAGWFFIPTYMTRERRPDEREKTFVSKEIFSRMEEQGEFFCQTHLFGNRYGTPRAHIIHATSSRSGRWMLDFALENRHLFHGVPHHTVILIPENWEQLETQLIESGRPERCPQALKDYNRYYQNLTEDDSTHDTLIVTNRRQGVTHTVDSIYHELSEGSRERLN